MQESHQPASTCPDETARKAVAIARGDRLGAELSAVSIVRNVGDLARARKFPENLKALETVISVASKSADACRALARMIQQVGKALDLLFINPHSAKSRATQDVPPTVLTPQVDNVIQMFPGGRPRQ